jgi:uncharacterized membrane protein HdeD (DUF308 family)
MEGSSVLIVRGIISVAIGIIAFLWPAITIAALVVLFGAYAIVDGITNLVLGFSRAGAHGRWAHVLQGVVGVAAGVLTFMWPAITGLVLIWLIGAWAVVTGVFEIAAAVSLRRVITGEWMLVLSGIVSILFGVLVFAFPLAGAVGISWILGVYAMTAGIILISLGVRLRKLVVAAV